MMNDLKLGTCVKNQNREVLSQDDLCKNTCGDMVGAVCSKGCMFSYSQLSGMTLFKNSIVDNNTVDALVINDGETLTTLIYLNIKSEEEIDAEKKKLYSFGLSKSEVSIFILVLEGKKNSQIIKELFISKATLKTHLNNGYKKLPEHYQQYKNRR